MLSIEFHGDTYCLETENDMLNVFSLSEAQPYPEC